MDLQHVQPVLDALLVHLSPGWVLAALLATINVCVFHVATAQEGHGLFYLAPFGLCGFAAGNLLAAMVGSPLPMLGDLHVIEASAGAWAVLLLANTRRVTT
jgi:hypothetical protein